MTAFEEWDLDVDLVAVGSSSGGLLAAILAHDLGLSAVVLEKSDALGGGTALSGGALWVPCNHLMLQKGLPDSREEAITYMRRISMGRNDEENTSAYVDTGPEVIRYTEERTPLKLMSMVDRPDYQAELPGGKCGGRCLVPEPLGMAKMLADAEKVHPLLSRVRRSPTGFLLGHIGLGLPATMFAGGRALIGGLVLGCLNRGIDILTNTTAKRLITDNGRVVGLRAERDGLEFFVRGKKGVMLATGGFEWNEQMNDRFIEGPSLHPITPPYNEGDGQIMGSELGAATALMDTSLWLPVARIPGEESEGRPMYRIWAAFMGRPGNIVVNREGKRCCDESYYPDVGRAFFVRDNIRMDFANLPMFWIADQSFRDKNPVGPLPVGTEMASWLHRSSTLRGLAEDLGIPADNLETTVERFNGFAKKGHDPEFHRGESAYDRWSGDPENKPNPSLGPLKKPPFYGVQIHLGTVGHRGGLVITNNAQVLNVRGEVIPGLYATSNTAAHLAIGSGYTSGFSQAQSMIFGYIAAQHMARAQ